VGKIGLLATEDFYVESATVPDADGEDDPEEGAAPEWTIIKDVDCW